MITTIEQPSTSGMIAEPMFRHSVYCIATSPIHAAQTVDRLKAAKFREESISALLTDPRMNWPFTKNKPHKLSEAALAGASIGVTWGWMAGFRASTIPGVGPFIAAGPIVAAMSGASVGDDVGGVCGSLVGIGIPEPEAKSYENKILNGEILLSVQTESREDMDRVRDIFGDSRADDIWANESP